MGREIDRSCREYAPDCIRKRTDGKLDCFPVWTHERIGERRCLPKIIKGDSNQNSIRRLLTDLTSKRRCSSDISLAYLMSKHNDNGNGMG